VKHAPAHPALLVFTVLGAALLVWLLVQGDDDPTPYADDDAPRETETQREHKARTPGTAREGRDEPAAAARRGIPRVLPPDAAVEDVRDALALEGEERATALRAASAAIGRLAAQGREALKPLSSYAKTVEDPVIRGVVTASLGSERSAANVSALAEAWARGATDAERMGALIALAHPHAASNAASNAASSAEAKSSRGKARSELLAGLPYDYVELAPAMSVLKAGARFLDGAAGALSQDALPVMLRSISNHSEWASLLVVDDTRMCAWYASLGSEDRARVRAQALKHEQLRGTAKAVIRNAE